ncbi:DUF3592 domain-containing protein [Kosakonia sp. SMBL-WEM22]|uniref:DUF3592 domain-containing protein n=1 Tax=Kosakonia sp. SMBL-WEM22 TaxID=2725560 RepID=UPI0016598286|nr:DUF3592 domain-containing protein [Kosakonia sp. SMBL-WEM22]QNQ20606.1 DUF3592 domain-containing protein [Kosakonia sp. SMBL-WEM22]
METFYIILIIIIGLLFGVFPMARFLHTSLYPYLKSVFMQEDVLSTGISVNALITHASQTTSYDGNLPIYRLTLSFKTVEQQQTEATIMKPLSFSEIERFAAGNYTIIKYDPTNPHHIAITDKPLILGD